MVKVRVVVVACAIVIMTGLWLGGCPTTPESRASGGYVATSFDGNWDLISNLEGFDPEHITIAQGQITSWCNAEDWCHTLSNSQRGTVSGNEVVWVVDDTSTLGGPDFVIRWRMTFDMIAQADGSLRGSEVMLILDAYFPFDSTPSTVPVVMVRR